MLSGFGSRLDRAMKIWKFNQEKYGVHLQMDLGVFEETPDFAFTPEVHGTDFFEIMVFVKGNGTLQLDTEKIEIRDSTFLFISPYQKRSWRVDRSRIKGYFLIFEKDFLAEFFSDKLFVYRLQYFYNRQVKTAFIPNSRLFSFENDIFAEIFHEIKNYQKDSLHLLRSIVYYVLIKLNREFCQYHQLENDTQLNNYAYLFKEALEKHIRNKQQVSEYAELLGISRVSLNAAVKQQFGVTAVEMIKDRLISEIKSELLYSTANISEISHELNFSESNNLIRLFKSRTGVSPRVFRNLNQIDQVKP